MGVCGVAGMEVVAAGVDVEVVDGVYEFVDGVL